jgi:hypothetical protein
LIAVAAKGFPVFVVNPALASPAEMSRSDRLAALDLDAGSALAVARAAELGNKHRLSNSDTAKPTS